MHLPGSDANRLRDSGALAFPLVRVGCGYAGFCRICCGWALSANCPRGTLLDYLEVAYALHAKV